MWLVADVGPYVVTFVGQVSNLRTAQPSKKRTKSGPSFAGAGPLAYAGLRTPHPTPFSLLFPLLPCPPLPSPPLILLPSPPSPYLHLHSRLLKVSPLKSN